MLTKRQAETLNYIRAFTRKNGYSPSYREIADHFGLSAVSTIAKHVKSLKEQGLIAHQWNRSRSLTTIPTQTSRATSRLIDVPLMGDIPAGPLQEIHASKDQSLQLDKKLIGKGRHFALYVRGESMIDAGILDGDIAILRQQSAIKTGQIGAFLVNNEVTLKKFFREKGKVLLMPANSSMLPIMPEGELEVQGILVLTLRGYAL